MNYFALAWSRPQHFQSYNLKILCNLYLYANIVGTINWGMGYGYLYTIHYTTIHSPQILLEPTIWKSINYVYNPTLSFSLDNRPKCVVTKICGLVALHILHLSHVPMCPPLKNPTLDASLVENSIYVKNENCSKDLYNIPIIMAFFRLLK